MGNTRVGYARFLSRAVCCTLLVACGGSDDGNGGEADGSTSDAGATTDARSSFDGASGDANAEREGDASIAEELRFRDGTRLKRVRMRAEGALDFLLNWYDTELDIECTFQKATDGELRCLPILNAGSLIYLDASCTTQLFVHDPQACTLALPPKMMATSAGNCASSGATELSPAPADVATRPLYARPSGGGACAQLSESEADQKRYGFMDHDLFVTGAAVELSRFVKVVREDRSDGVPSRIGSVAEDGTEQLWGHTGADGVRCTPTAYGGTAICLPKEARVSSTYTDATCQTGALVGGANSSLCPYEDIAAPSVSVVTQNACDRTVLPKFFGIAVSTPANLYRLQGTMCVAAQVEPQNTYWTRTSERSASTFTQLTAREVGTGRLRVRSLEDDRGRRVAVDSRLLWDDKLQQNCIGGRIHDGRMYCTPSEFALAGYRDSDCTQQVLSSTCGGLREGSYVVNSENDFSRPRCARSVFYKVGKTLPNDAPLFRKISGVCIPWTTPGPHVYASAGEVPITEFAELTRVVGP